MLRTSTGSTSSGRYLLTPTTTSSALVDARLALRPRSSMRSLGMPDSTALVMPPSASTSSISVQASVGQGVASGAST